MSMDYLAKFPGLEYLMLIPPGLRCQVANWCRMSPTVQELRDVMLSYGELSEEVSRVMLTDSGSLVCSLRGDPVWSVYWKAFLLGPIEDSDEFRHELNRRLGPPALSGGVWKPSQLDSGVVDVVDSVEGLSFAAVPQAVPVAVPFDVDTVAGLFERLSVKLSRADRVRTGYGLSAVRASPYKQYVDVLMDKFHVWQDVGGLAVDRSLPISGFCYLKLFTSDVHDVIVLALGAYPDSEMVAAFYVAGVVYGFSNLGGLALKVEKVHRDDSHSCLHVVEGSMLSSELFAALLKPDAVVGGKDFFSSDTTLVPGMAQLGRRSVLKRVDLESSAFSPAFEDLIVCMDSESYILALNRIRQFRGAHGLVMWNTSFVPTRVVWVVSYKYAAIMSQSQREFLAILVGSRTSDVYYVHNPGISVTHSDVFYLSMLAGSPLHTDFHSVDFGPTVCKSYVRSDPLGAFRAMMASSSSFVANVHSVGSRNLVATTADSTGVVVMVRGHAASGESNVYVSVVKYPVDVVVLVPPSCKPGVFGAKVETRQSTSCVLLDAGACFQVETDGDFKGVLLSYVNLDSTPAKSYWFSSIYVHNPSSNESVMAGGRMYLQAPTSSLVCNTTSTVVELSEPFDGWKSLKRYRVVARDKKFSVELPVTGRVIVGRLYSEADDPDVTLTVGHVTLVSDASVSVHSSMLKLCTSNKKRRDRVSFNIFAVADEDCFDVINFASEGLTFS